MKAIGNEFADIARELIKVNPDDKAEIFRKPDSRSPTTWCANQ